MAKYHHMTILLFIVDFTTLIDILECTGWWLSCVHFGNLLWMIFSNIVQPQARQGACRLDVLGQNCFQLVSEVIPIIPWGVAGVAHRSKRAIVKRLIIRKFKVQKSTNCTISKGLSQTGKEHLKRSTILKNFKPTKPWMNHPRMEHF